ncbi:major head protein [Vibrio phage K567]
MTVSIGNGLPDIVTVQKRLYPLIFTEIVSEQPTKQPIATAYGFKAIKDTDDSSGWEQWKFSLDRWSATAEATKLKTDISLEAIQDMEALGLGTDLIVDSLADQAADDINTNIITALNAISTLGTAVSVNSTTGKFNKGRELYALAHVEAAKLEKETGCQGSYIVAGGETFGLIVGSGMAKRIGESNVYKLDSGLKLVHDKYATSEYFTVGVKKEMSDFEISSLIFSPYNFDGETGGGIAYQHEGQDPKTFNPIFAIIARYALTVAPLESDQTGASDIDWDDLGDKANSSKLSATFAVTL